MPRARGREAGSDGSFAVTAARAERVGHLESFRRRLRERWDGRRSEELVP
jgi:hypothetical protein